MSEIIPPSDLTRRPPRSPRVRLGGYAILPRAIDKGRATVKGTQGEYNYDCPTDQQFFEFVGVSPTDFKMQIEAGLGDGELLAWVEANATHKRLPHEIAAWSHYVENRVPSLPESREFFQEVHKTIALARGDIGTWFDLLDLDDYASYGGKP